MKSEHRHELKTNELAEWIANFPQWAKENTTTIIYLVVLAVVVVGVYFWKVYQKKAVATREQVELTNFASQVTLSKPQILLDQPQGIDSSYVFIQAADNLQKIAQNTKNEQAAALALIKRGEALRTELRYRLGSVPGDEITNQINQAKDSYTKAIEMSSSNPSLTAAAKFGLGLCEEDLGNFEQAREIYSEIAANPDFEGTVAAEHAKRRLPIMADYQKKVFIKPSPEPAPTETITPELQLEVPEGFRTQPEIPEFNLPGQP
jgi:tetratricopeptide (TPR) repeat protein